MFRIVQISVSESVAERDGASDYLSERALWGTDFADLKSEPLCTAGSAYFEITQYLSQIGYEMNETDLTDKFVLVATKAPDSYDWGGITLRVADLGSGERLVACQRGQADAQMARYSSGLHPSRKIS